MSNQIKKAVIGVLILSGLVVIGIFISKGDVFQNQSEQNVATVNGKEITRSQLDFQIALTEANTETKTLVPPKEEMEKRNAFELEILQGVINEYLFFMDAERHGISITNEEVENQINSLGAQFENNTAFENQLASLGINREKLHDNLTRQMTNAKYKEQLVEENKISAIDEEIKTFYQESKGNQANFPALEEIKDQIRTIIEQRKIGEIIKHILDGLRESADIKITL